MSREVRRVPVGWQHPIEDNPYWLDQKTLALFRRDYVQSLLHPPDKCFVSLLDDYPGAMTQWEQEGKDLQARIGRDWDWDLRYHLTGYVCEPSLGPWAAPLDEQHHHEEPQVHPKYIVIGDVEVPIDVRDEDHLFEMLWGEHERSHPRQEDYMPVFDVPVEDLGWCLYQTVSEGTPVTPVFATADELIDHLATVGQDHNQKPMRREAAETLVRAGFSMGSMVVINGEVLMGDDDADRIADLTQARGDS